MTSSDEKFIIARNEKILAFMSPNTKLFGHAFLNLHYNDSFNCAHAVVSRIESLRHPLFGGDKKFIVEIKGNFCRIFIELNKKELEICNVESETKLEAMNKAFIKFINWYKENG